MSTTGISVPKRIVRPHTIIARTRDAARRLRAGPDGRLEVGRVEGVLHLRVSKSKLPRALQVAQGIFDEAERRGYAVGQVEKAHNHVAGVGITLRELTYALRISELTDRVPLTEADLKRWHREHTRRLYFGDPPQPPETKPIANGRLQLSLEHSYGSGRQSNWSEGPRVGTLDERLPAFFFELEARAAADVAKRERLQRARAAREREQRIELQRRRLAQVEAARADQLFSEAAAWRRAQEARAYIGALRNRLDQLSPEERDRVVAWVEWSARYVDRHDPAQNTTLIEGLTDPRGDRPLR